MGLRGDRGAIEGLPLQLLIVAVVAALTAPAVYAGLEALDRSNVESRVHGELLRFARAAQQYMVAGGGAETLTLDLRSGSLTPVEWIVVGDFAGEPLEGTIRYRVGGSERAILVERPALRMSTPEGRPLLLWAGVHELRIEISEDRVWVEAVA